MIHLILNAGRQATGFLRALAAIQSSGHTFVKARAARGVHIPVPSSAAEVVAVVAMQFRHPPLSFKATNHMSKLSTAAADNPPVTDYC